MIVKVIRRILAAMAGVGTMLKQAQRVIPTAKPRGVPIDIDAGYERVMARFPRIMARLGE